LVHMRKYKKPIPRMYLDDDEERDEQAAKGVRHSRRARAHTHTHTHTEREGEREWSARRGDTYGESA
jgi:hypothetical protein